MKMNKFWNVALLGAVVALSTSAFAKGDKGAKTPLSPEQKAERRTERRELMQSLNLTASQKAEMKTLRRATRTKVEAVRANTQLSPEESRAQIKALHKDSKAQMLDILTPEQRQKLAAFAAQRKADRKAARGR